MTNKIISRKTWGARYRNGVGSRKVGRLEKYFHHTVTAHLDADATLAQEYAQMRALEQIGQQRFGAGISYNLVVFPSGRVYEGASVSRISYHSGGGRNTRGVGVVLAGNFEANKLNTKTFNAVVWLLQEGVRRKWWGDPALTSYHKKFRSTACPGKYAIARFDDINAAGRGKAVAAPKTTAKAKATSKGKAWPRAAVPVTSSHTAASHNAWTKLLAGNIGPKKQGYKDKNLTVNFQRWLRDLGYYKGVIDGKFGPWTIEALQLFLRAKGFYKGRVDGKRQPYNVARGPMMVRAEIAYINSQRKHYV